MKKKIFRSKNSWILSSILLTLVVYLLGQGGSLLLTSVVNRPEHEPFNGTTYPVKEAPDWIHLTASEYKLSYDEMPSEKMGGIPRYDADDFETPFSDLAWNDELRNSKITYSVPYMGDYSLDSTEYAGGHLGVDIKIPMRTPIYAIANGVVIKASNQANGYGQHIVLEHDNSPTLEDKDETTTYYSGYCHLDELLVSENDVVSKGDLIGYSGQTGTATTPHLHFQIDNDEMDWHPYWPFTWQDQKDAGLSFFEAVNAGLGKDLAIEASINPMEYVQKYLNSSSSKSTKKTTKKAVKTVEHSSVKTTEEDENDDIENTDAEEKEDPALSVLKFVASASGSYTTDDTFYVKIKAVDGNGNSYKKEFDGVLGLSLENGIGNLSDNAVAYEDFENGNVRIAVKNLTEGTDRVLVNYDGVTYASDYFTVTLSTESAKTPSTKVRSFTDLFKSHPNYKAVIYLADSGVVSGYSDGSFKPSATVTRAEALKMILDGIKAPNEIDDLSFGDVKKTDWYYKYVSTGYLKKIVSGYSDGTFKPGNTVTKAEFLRMLFTAMDVNLPSTVREAPFKDVDSNEWYAKYFQYAKKNDIIDNNLRALPNEGMTRAEVAEAMYRVMND